MATLQTNTSEADRLLRALASDSVTAFRGRWVVVRQAEPRDDGTTAFTLQLAEYGARPPDLE